MEIVSVNLRRIVGVVALAGMMLPLAAGVAGAALDQSCVITLSLIDAVSINNLEVTVDYSNAGGQIEGSGASPVCRRSLGGTLAAFNDNDETKILKLGMLRVKPFSGPAEIAGCRFAYDTTVPAVSAFHTEVQVAASNGDDGNVDPLPRVEVTAIDCPGDLPYPTTTTTTTITTTTTTIPGVTTTIPGEGRCGFPVSNGDKPLASDALYSLRAAVGLVPCSNCVCDVDGNTRVTASDALAVLRIAVGLEFPLSCPGCA